jgi:UDP-N-acetylmuramate--alanine ligase
VFDDYAHHPVEIAAVLRAARASTRGNVVAVVQPHRYTRLQSLFEQFSTCFNDADAVIVADVYPAGEKPIEGIDKQSLVSAIKAHGHRNAIALDGPEALPDIVRGLVKAGDYVVFVGAGNITQWAYALPEQLAGAKA